MAIIRPILLQGLNLSGWVSVGTGGQRAQSLTTLIPSFSHWFTMAVITNHEALTLNIAASPDHASGQQVESPVNDCNETSALTPRFWPWPPLVC
jgi:hypothetical protein